MSARNCLAGAPRAGGHGTPSWARLLSGDAPWLMLVALLAFGLLVYTLVRESLPASVAVVLGGLAANVCGLAANVWWLHRTEAVEEERT